MRISDWSSDVCSSDLLAAYSFAVLFRAQRRDYPLVMFAAALGYAVTRLSGLWLLPEHGTFPLGVFSAGLVVTAASNIYARSANRPGELIREIGRASGRARVCKYV